MSNIIERFHELEAGQEKREKEQEEREKKELEEAVTERTAVVNRGVADRARPLVSILKETKIEEILKETRGVKKDLTFEIKLGAGFSTEKGGHWKYRNFSNISDISSSEMIFPVPYEERYYEHRMPETLLEAKSLKLEGGIFLRVEVRWGNWGDSDDYGYSYIKIEPKYLEKRENPRDNRWKRRQHFK